MVIKNIKLFLAVFLIAIIFNCSGASPYSSSRIREEVKEMVVLVSQNREAIVRLKKRKIGESGFFYIVNRSGRIVMHPKPYLTGSYFGNNKYIKEIIRRKNGCLKYKIGHLDYLIFFEPLDENEIVCFSIQMKEIKDDPGVCIEEKKIK